MKTKILLVILTGILSGYLPMAASDPPYRSYFGEEYTKWYTYHAIIDYGEWSSMIMTLDEEKTLSNNLEYKVAYFKQAHPPHEEASFYYYMRENRETGELFIRINEEEILISSMNLEVGDKFYFSKYINKEYNFHPLHKDDEGYYTIVESVYYEGGRKHVRCEATCMGSYAGQSLVFIEGIGPLSPFIYFYYLCFENELFERERHAPRALVCYETENDFWEIEDEWWIDNVKKNDCFFYREGGNIDEIETFPFKIFYEKESIKIEFQEALKDGILILYSVNGQEVYRTTTGNNYSLSIPVVAITPGMYLLQVLDNNKTWTKKIMLK